MPRPARVLAIPAALVAAGLLVGGTAYAAARSQSADETYVACVDIATGAMRLIDPLTGQACNAVAGPGQEREISWSRTAGERGPQGPAGPRGPRGEDGEDGEDGDDGRLRSLDDLAGVRCESGDSTGRVEVRVQPPERGSGIQLICMTDDTVTTTRTPAPPAPDLPRPTWPRPTRTAEPAPSPPMEPTREPEPTAGDDRAGDPGDDPAGDPDGFPAPPPDEPTDPSVAGPPAAR